MHINMHNDKYIPHTTYVPIYVSDYGRISILVREAGIWVVELKRGKSGDLWVFETKLIYEINITRKQ